MELCAACIYRNGKFCGQRCRLAPYFPASMSEEYAIVREFHGDNNILRILDFVKEEDKKEAVQSLIAAAKMRMKDPVLGIVAVEMQLRSEVEAAREMLEQAKKQLPADAQEGTDSS